MSIEPKLYVYRAFDFNPVFLYGNNSKNLLKLGKMSVLDDVTINVVPEAAALLLLGLDGVLIRRRRISLWLYIGLRARRFLELIKQREYS